MRSRAVSASVRPQDPTSAGASDQPRRVPAGMVMLIRAGSGVLRPVWSSGEPGGGPSNPAGRPSSSSSCSSSSAVCVVGQRRLRRRCGRRGRRRRQGRRGRRGRSPWRRGRRSRRRRGRGRRRDRSRHRRGRVRGSAGGGARRSQGLRWAIRSSRTAARIWARVPGRPALRSRTASASIDAFPASASAGSSSRPDRHAAPGVLAAQLDPPVVPGLVLPPLDALGVEAGLEPGGLLMQVRQPDLRGGVGQDLVGLGGQVVRQVQGGVADHAGAVAVDDARGHPGQRGRQPVDDVGGHVEQQGGAVGAGGHLEAELLGRVLPVPGPDPVAARLRRLQLLGAAAAEPRDRQDLDVVRVGAQPPRGRTRPEQLPLIELIKRPDRLSQQGGELGAGRRRARGPVAENASHEGTPSGPSAGDCDTGHHLRPGRSFIYILR